MSDCYSLSTRSVYSSARGARGPIPGGRLCRKSHRSCSWSTMTLSVRESLEALIRTEGWRAETFTSTRRSSCPWSRVQAPSCLILDVSLPDLNGLDLQKRIADDRIGSADHLHHRLRRYPHVRIQAMKAGAVEFLTKPFEEEALLGAIRQAIDHSQATLRDETKLQALRDCYTLLSRREREVMALVVSGLLNKQVGGELGISEITVKAHSRQGDGEDEGRLSLHAELVTMRAHASALRPSRAPDASSLLNRRRPTPRCRRYPGPIDCSTNTSGVIGFGSVSELSGSRYESATFCNARYETFVWTVISGRRNLASRPQRVRRGYLHAHLSRPRGAGQLIGGDPDVGRQAGCERTPRRIAPFRRPSTEVRPILAVT